MLRCWHCRCRPGCCLLVVELPGSAGGGTSLPRLDHAPAQTSNPCTLIAMPQSRDSSNQSSSMTACNLRATTRCSDSRSLSPNQHTCWFDAIAERMHSHSMAFVHVRTPTLARAAAAEQHSRALAVLRLLSLATSSGSISSRLQANCKLSGLGLHMPSMNTPPTTTVVPTLAR